MRRLKTNNNFNIIKTLRLIFTIAFSFFFNCSSGQQNLDVCNCFQNPTDCIPLVSKRNIVRNDTLIAHHSYCYEIVSSDENRSIVVLTFLCDTKPTDPFLLTFFDSTTLGTKSQTWYDTSGKFIYYVSSKNDIIKECFWYHYPQGVKNYDYIIGYRKGELFKELYTWDKYGATHIRKVIITKGEIRTEIRTDERDAYGYSVWKISTEPNKTGKVE